LPPAARSPNPDVDEVHILLTGDDPLVPAGSPVKLQCQLPDGSGYLATALASLSSVTVLTVAAADLDGLPRGPFTETCEHWQQRHHVQTIE
jgi:hypothetical protein